MNDAVREVLCKLPRHIKFPYVFYRVVKGEARPYGDLHRRFSSTAERAGIGHIRFHDLRHTFASHLVMKGVDTRTVQALMGHKNISTTMRYAHLAPDHLKSAVGRLHLTGWHKSGTNASERGMSIQL